MNGFSEFPNYLNPKVFEVKLLLTRDEVSYLFGFDDLLVDQLHQESGASINMVGNSNTVEVVACIGGNLEVVFKALSLICRKLWDFISNRPHGGQMVVRLAVHRSLCGSIIGKQGNTIKEIRDMTGANIQVDQECLPNSSERCIEISGSGDSCLQCVYQMCVIIQDTPLKGKHVAYVPRAPQPQGSIPQQSQPQDAWRPVFLCGEKAYVIDGNVARIAPPDLLRNELSKTALGGQVAQMLASDMPGLSAPGHLPDHMNPLRLMLAISNSQRNNGGVNYPMATKEVTVSAELIHRIVNYDNGQKIIEMEQMSGAQVHIGSEQLGGDLLVTFRGSEESILLAQFLLQCNIDLVMRESQSNADSASAFPQLQPFQEWPPQAQPQAQQPQPQSCSSRDPRQEKFRNGHSNRSGRRGSGTAASGSGPGPGAGGGNNRSSKSGSSSGHRYRGNRNR